MLHFLFYLSSFLYLEVIFHIGAFGFHLFNPLPAIGAAVAFAAVASLIAGLFEEKGHKVCTIVVGVLQWFLFSLHTGYYHIFKQPILFRAVFEAGGDAVTDFQDLIISGAVAVLPILLLNAVPTVVYCILLKKQKLKAGKDKLIDRLQLCAMLLIGILFLICFVKIGTTMNSETVEEYTEFYDPETVLEKNGVLPFFLRDIAYEIGGGEEEEGDGPDFPVFTPNPILSATPTPVQSSEPETDPVPGEPTPEPTPVIDTSPNVWNIDLNKLSEASQGSKETKWLAEYIAGMTPTNKNEYTGMFEGYNLIFLTAEGFSTYAIREDLTPTLYKMVNSSFVFDNYYVPIWSTSTSDGEYVNTTGLIPDGQFSMKKSAENQMSCSLPRFFSADGVFCRAYHNNSLTYYDRHLSHPNLGYYFKAIKLGDLSASEWGDHLFTVEHPNAWPASDYEMMQSTIPEYINDDRFHVYYMTVSGHMNYNFKGNRMSSWNKEAVADFDMSENARAYLACNIELEKAMAYLVEQLEAAGKLENTVICLSADHYPYGMSEEQYEELAGKDLSAGMDYYRNSLILWCGGMEETIHIQKPCCSVDILPTLLNLFGYDYDSRMYAGRDILSTAPGLVIFKDQSFVSDILEYNKKTKEMVWHADLSDADKDTYFTEIKKEVKNRYLGSAYILRNDYYKTVEECIVP